VRAGVRTIEHCSFVGAQGFGGDFDPALVREMAARVPRLWVAPTVNSGWAKHCHPDGKATEFGTRMGRVLRGLAEAGVSLIASTDAGIPGVHHDRLAESLEVLARLTGLAPVEVLRAATSEAAEALGIADTVGTLGPGRSADVLVVAGNPLEDLEVLTRPRLVVARGQLVARNGSLDSS
ncbi:MAG: amidohydrolase family protein, partial [Acidobacteriota bacterium]